MNSFELMENLENVVVSHPYNPITFDGSEVCHLNRWLITSALKDKKRFDSVAFYNSDAKVLSLKETETLETEELETNWRFYISDDASSFYKRNSPEKLFNNTYDRKYEKYIYFLSGVYCERETELSVHISTTLPMPIKLWINGQIVLIGTIENFLKDHVLSFRFKQGINTVLVEKPMCASNRRLALTPKWFSVSTRSIKSITDTAIAKVINQEEILHTHLSSYTIHTDKLFYDYNDSMQIMVLKNNNKNENEVCVELTYSNTETVYQYTVKAGTVESIPLIIDNSNIVKISVLDTDDCCYVFAGDFEKYILSLEAKITQATLSASDKQCLLFNLEILDKNKGFIINSIEPIHKYYSQPVLSKLLLFEKQYRIGVFKDYLHNGINAFVSPIDGEKLAYFLQIPIKMESLCPLIVYFNFDDSSTRIPTAPNRVFFENPDNAITLVFCGRGDYMNDYINEFEIISVIDYIINRFPVNKKRIHFYGICTGARRGFNFLNKNNNIFASMFSFAGTPTEINDLTPNHQIPIYQLCNIDDVIYNGATMQKNATNNKSKTFCVSNFEHEELIDYFCNKNSINLLLSHKQTIEPNLKEIITNTMNIKSVYLDQCTVIINQQEQNGVFAPLLTQPLKYRARNYKFSNVLPNMEIDFRQSNFIFVFTFNKLNENIPNEIIELAISLINDFDINDYENYFIMSIEKNPFNPQKKILLIIVSGHEAKKELFSLWERFDYESLFDKRQIAFLRGNYIYTEENI